MAHAHHITSSTDAHAEFVRLAALDFEPWTGEIGITSERWGETFIAVQIALALMELSKEGLTAAIANDNIALDAAFDDLGLDPEAAAQVTMRLGVVPFIGEHRSDARHDPGGSQE